MVCLEYLQGVARAAVVWCCWVNPERTVPLMLLLARWLAHIVELADVQQLLLLLLLSVGSWLHCTGLHACRLALLVGVTLVPGAGGVGGTFGRGDGSTAGVGKEC
jgi:hypothetical protein